MSRSIFVLRRPFLSDGGHAWRISLPMEQELCGDQEETPRASQWTLLEDGTKLGPAHEVHASIREVGAGAYSHWKSTLYFSTSDNTDPNSNNKTYALATESLAPIPWLAAYNERRAREGTVFSDVSKQTNLRGLIAVFGSSYCGSTLLNTMLNAHPEIYAGGELHWLVTDASVGCCALCGKNCRFWTAKNRADLGYENIYNRTAEIFGRPFIVDASKMCEWFDPVLPANPRLATKKVLLVKHPVRQISSYIEKARREPHLARFRDPRAAIRSLQVFYDEVFRKHEFDLIIRYEDLVLKSEQTLRMALDLVGLEWDERMLNWANAEHHHIGGNVGPRVQIAHHDPGSDLTRRKYAQPGVFLDNSYSEVLTLSQIGEILSAEPCRAIIAKFYGQELDCETDLSPD